MSAMLDSFRYRSVHPGEILKEELQSRGLSCEQFAEILHVPPRVVAQIVATRRPITPEMPLRIGTALGTVAHLWMAVQLAHSLHRTETELGAKIRHELGTAG